jgi:organic hydroperoxide reductase OsmC/OhrA
MGREHGYRVSAAWTGNQGEGTSHYRAYSRDHDIRADGKQVCIPCSSDPAFRGDPGRYNPEELLLGALSSCHMLWVLHLCAEAGIVVTAYSDDASAVMTENADGSGQFTGVTLRPRLTVLDPARIAELPALHERAHEMCFISRSVNFPVEVAPSAEAASARATLA